MDSSHGCLLINSTFFERGGRGGAYAKKLFDEAQVCGASGVGSTEMLFVSPEGGATAKTLLDEAQVLRVREGV